MSSKNPYDAYDPLDPWGEDDLDDTGEFAFVEDEYDSLDYAGDDGFGYPYGDMPIPDEGPVRGSTEEMPRTMVRPRAVDVTQARMAVPAPPRDGGVLRRHRRTGAERTSDGRTGGYPGAEYGAPHNGRQVVAEAPRRRRHGRRHHGCLVTILVFVTLMVGAYWLVAHPVDERLAFTPEEQETVNGTLSWSVPGTPYYLLALGSDAREGDSYSRTDTMMLIRVDLVGGKLTLLSIPRDTKVELEGYGTQKINAAYAYGGAGGAVRAVHELTGAPIHHVAVVHFEELVGLVDYLGGVTVNVPVAVDDAYTGVSIAAGEQVMDGATALAWARTRYGYARGDFQRQEDQRILLTAIMNRMLSLSPREIPGALERVGDLVGTDMRCYDLVPLFVRFRLSNPTVYSTSVPSTTATIDGVSYVIADDAALAQLMETINAGDDPGDPVN